MDLLSHPTSLHVPNIVITEEIKNVQSNAINLKQLLLSFSGMKMD